MIEALVINEYLGDEKIFLHSSVSMEMPGALVINEYLGDEKMLTHSSVSMDTLGALELFGTKSSRH